MPALPACTEPMVTTPNFAASFSRLMTLCTSTMKWPAIITGSMVTCGREPWPPLPVKSTDRLSEVELMTPGR